MIRIRIRLAAGKQLKPQSLHKLSIDTGKSDAAKKRRAMHGNGLQYAALPYRVADGFEILLITSRNTGRWVLPKGWPMRGKKPHAAAAREALEEAGVRGKIAKRAIGRYTYGKHLSDGALLTCTVEVYPLAVARRLKRWPEQGQRTLSWFRPSEAAALVDEADLSALIEAFAGGLSAWGTDDGTG